MMQSSSHYYLVLLQIVLLLASSAFIIYLWMLVYKKRKQEAIKKLPFTEEYESILSHIKLYKELTGQEKQKIHESILFFINTKEFQGIGIDVTVEMKIVIAFHACLLILHTNLEGCYDELDIILIYPSPMVLKNVSSTGGIFTKSDFLIEGQSAGGTVVISWHDAKKDAYHPHHENVLLHEFAHELDFMEGAVDGTPLLEYSKYHEWGIILSKEFRKLQNVALKNRNWGKYHEIGAYAATNEAEFFAVITERFFEDKKSFAKKFPDLYKELYNFYYSTLKKY